MEKLEIGLCWGTVYKAGLIEMIEAAAACASGSAMRGQECAWSIAYRADCPACPTPRSPSMAGPCPAPTKPPASPWPRRWMRRSSTSPISAPPRFPARSWWKPSPASAAGRASVASPSPWNSCPIPAFPALKARRPSPKPPASPTAGSCSTPGTLPAPAALPKAIATLPPDSIGALQLCDRTEPPPGTPYKPMSGRDLPGEGELPLAKIVKAARANSPGITAEIEVFSDELAAMEIDAAAERAARAVAAWRASHGI